MKKLTLVVIALVLSVGTAFAQTWTVYGDSDCDFEYTVITREQFERLVKAHETTDPYVRLTFQDKAEMGGGRRVIKGTKPQLRGYCYLLAKLVNLSQTGQYVASMVNCVLLYGNSEIGAMSIMFMNTYDGSSRTISLKYDWNEYARQYNQLINLVNGE